MIFNIEYRNGAEGMIKWCNDNVYCSIFPEGSDIPVWVPMGELPDTPIPQTGKSYLEYWKREQEVLGEALRMENGRFIYKLIIFCWPRGEGKSFIAVIIQLWKFFCFPKQLITLAANSKDQVKFVHYDIMRDTIRNSPNLIELIGEKNIQEKEIRLTDDNGQVKSTIRTISSFSGVVSNITGYTFSEVFDMKNPKFFQQLDGSVRNTPNALGVIDSTVSAKDHFLYSLYTGCIAGKTKTVFFSYRYSKKADPADYWHPMMDKIQLDDYKVKLHIGGGFAKYFKNLWSAGSTHVFSEAQIEEMSYFGIDGMLLNHKEIVAAIEKKNHYHEVIESISSRGLQASSGVIETKFKITKIDKRFSLINDVYILKDKYNNPLMPMMEDLERLGDMFNTYWAILASVDMADPLSIRSYARSILTIIAKGLPGSRENIQGINEAAPKYIYFLLHLAVARNKTLDSLKEEADKCHEELDGIDVFCVEQFYAYDMKTWCESRNIAIEILYPSYSRQNEAFNNYYTIVEEGRFKVPSIGIGGSKKPDIFREEMAIFDADEDNKWYGSLEKKEVRGIQDDTQYSTAWGLYGGRHLGVDDFRLRNSMLSFGEVFINEDLVGKY